MPPRIRPRLGPLEAPSSHPPPPPPPLLTGRFVPSCWWDWGVSGGWLRITPPPSPIFECGFRTEPLSLKHMDPPPGPSLPISLPRIPQHENIAPNNSGKGGDPTAGKIHAKLLPLRWGQDGVCPTPTFCPEEVGLKGTSCPQPHPWGGGKPSRASLPTVSASM